MVYYNHDILLAQKDSSVALGPFDGKVASCITHGEKIWLVTSPNQGFIPQPALGAQETRIRADMRFGIADFTLWPQPLLADQGHLPLVQRRLTSGDNPLNILWADASSEDFVPSRAGLVSGLGELSPKWLLQLLQLKRKIDADVTLYKEAVPSYSTKSITTVSTMQIHIHHAFVRLNSLKMTFLDIRFTISEFQRAYLELDAYITYMSLMRQSSASSRPSSSRINASIGCFTMDASAAQKLFDVDVPFWFIREWDGTTLKSNILQLVDTVDPRQTICMVEQTPPGATIATFKFGSSLGFLAILSFSASRLLAQDSLSPLPLAPTSSGSSVGRQQSASAPTSRPMPYTRKPKANPNVKPPIVGRNKYLELESPYAPFPIPGWSWGLSKVNFSPAMLRVDARETAYSYPDPGLIVSSNKFALFLTTWLQIRSDWMSLLDSGTPAMKSQEWRDLLSLDLRSSPSDGSTVSAKRRSAILRKLAPNQSHKFGSGMNVNETSSSLPIWRGQLYTPNEIPPVPIVREILWELYELNFQKELLALDRRLYQRPTQDHSEAITYQQPDTNSLYLRMTLVSSCFDRFQSPQIQRNDVGLAHHNEEDRLHFLQALADVMVDWPDHPPCIKYVSNLRASRLGFVGREKFLAVEREMAAFYCQQFFNQFGRAAQIPHCLYQPSH